MGTRKAAAGSGQLAVSCQLDPTTVAVRPSAAGFLLSNVTSQSYGHKHLLSLAVLMGFVSADEKSSKDRTYEATIPDVLLPARSLGFLTALGKPTHLADRNHPST